MTTDIPTTPPTIQESDPQQASLVDGGSSRLSVSEAELLRADAKRILAEGEAEFDRLNAIEKASQQTLP